MWSFYIYICWSSLGPLTGTLTAEPGSVYNCFGIHLNMLVLFPNPWQKGRLLVVPLIQGQTWNTSKTATEQGACTTLLPAFIRETSRCHAELLCMLPVLCPHWVVFASLRSYLHRIPICKIWLLDESTLPRQYCPISPCPLEEGEA